MYHCQSHFAPGVLWNAFKVFAKHYSADEKTALFSGTAAKVYRPGWAILLRRQSRPLIRPVL
jgi:hypothetical protein